MDDFEKQKQQEELRIKLEHQGHIHEGHTYNVVLESIGVVEEKCLNTNQTVLNSKITELNQQDDTIKYERDEGDIRIVMLQTKCTREQAVSAIKNNNGDLLSAILELVGL